MYLEGLCTNGMVGIALDGWEVYLVGESPTKISVQLKPQKTSLIAIDVKRFEKLRKELESANQWLSVS